MQAKYYCTILLMTVLLSAFASVTVDADNGCPYSESTCHSYCRSHGFAFGYCGGFLNFDCTCHGNQ